MGVSFEDIAAVEALHRGVIPPTANSPTVDPVLVREERGRGKSPVSYRGSAG